MMRRLVMSAGARWTCAAAFAASAGGTALGAEGQAAVPPAEPVGKNVLGAYGQWAASLSGKGPGQLSFRNPQFKSLEDWRKQAAGKTLELLAIPDMPWKPEVRVEKQFEFEGLAMEVLSWQLPYGPRTEALFMKPAGAKGRLPAVLALHDHGGMKYYGVRKITRVPGEQLAPMREHQATYYGGNAWANEIAKRGYAVLVHDVFTFGSRRIRYADVPDALTGGRTDRNPDSPEEAGAYNAWASGQADSVSKSLLCAGTTWAGLMLYDDQRALDYLCSRPDVDAARLACGGLSGGGLRTVMLGGLDDRIKAAFPVGFMTTWRDFMLYKSYTHTWMAYVPRLPNYLDFPEILGLRAPLHTFVLNDSEDQIFTLKEMQAADGVLREVYAKAGTPGNYRCSFYPGPHKFDAAMQKDAFAWLDGIMKPTEGKRP